MRVTTPATGRVLVALHAADPATWRRAVAAALATAGDVPSAAAALQVTRRTLDRWLVAHPDLRAGAALPAPGARTDLARED